MTDSITLLVPVDIDRPVWLLESAASILGQGCRQVRLHLLVSPQAPACLPVAAALVRRDQSVTWEQVETTAPWDTVESAFIGVTTRFCGVVGLGDRLLPGSLDALVEVLADDDCIDMVYSDEQWNTTAERGDETSSGASPVGAVDAELVVRLKPRLSPHYLEANDYTGRLAVYRCSALRPLGGWRAAAGPAMEWDAAMRLIDSLAPGRRVAHLPMVAVHRRLPPAELDTHPDRTHAFATAQAAGREVVREHLDRIGQVGEVTAGPLPGFVRVRRPVPSPAPHVSIVIPTAGARRDVAGSDVELVNQCLERLESMTAYPAWDAHVVISHHAPDDLEHRLSTTFGSRVSATRLPPATFNFSTSVNTGVLTTDAPLVLLLNDDVVPLASDWLDVMVGAVTDGRVGAVGAKLLDGDDLIQHAGVTHDEAWHPSHPHRMERAAGNSGHFGSLVVATDYSALTAACLLTPRAVFEQVGGFSLELGVAYGDVDYCWKVAATGRWCVMAADAVLRHYESSSRDPRVDPEELQMYLSRWADHARDDIGVQFRRKN